VGFLPRPAISDDSPRLFEHDAMEMLSRTHPLVVAVLYAPTVIALIVFGTSVVTAGTATLLAWFAAGVLVWTLTEYGLHRGIMHWVPAAAWGPKFHFWVHGIHHAWPKDPYRLVMPPLVSLVLFCVFLAIFYLILGDYCWMFHAGFTFGYLAYDLTHYAYHHYTLKSPLLQRWQHHHLLHHFNRRYANSNYSISIPLWDRVFRTHRAQVDDAEAGSTQGEIPAQRR